MAPRRVRSLVQAARDSRQHAPRIDDEERRRRPVDRLQALHRLVAGRREQHEAAVGLEAGQAARERDDVFGLEIEGAEVRRVADGGRPVPRLHPGRRSFQVIHQRQAAGVGERAQRGPVRGVGLGQRADRLGQVGVLGRGAAGVGGVALRDQPGAILGQPRQLDADLRLRVGDPINAWPTSTRP